MSSLAERVGARFVAHRVEVQPGSNLEARARAARFSVLPAGVLTAHTMDDQAETVVLNLLRGSGLDGLAGMSAPTKPMLGLRRTEVRAYVIAEGAVYVIDPTNFDLSLRRNIVRARVLPELCRVAGRDLVPVLARQSTLLGADAAFLDEAARRAIPDPTDVALLRAAPEVLRRRRLRDLARSVDDAHPPSSDEVERMEAVVRNEVIATQLAGGRRLARRGGRLLLEEQ